MRTSHVMTVYFFSKDKDGEKYGFLPKMAIASRGSIGALMATSFCESIISCSNLVSTEETLSWDQTRLWFCA